VERRRHGCRRPAFSLIDRAFYAESTNLTGAALGVKKAERRSFETGFVSTDPSIVAWHEETFDRIWSTSLCESCERREFCE